MSTVLNEYMMKLVSNLYRASMPEQPRNALFRTLSIIMTVDRYGWIKKNQCSHILYTRAN